MKRLMTFCMMLFVVLSAVMAGNNPRAVSLVSYEQSWLDIDGALSLKNNTNEDITNVSFRIIYCDMKGNQLDFKDFNYTVLIPPGMAKKINIPAYECDRNYYYYKSDGSSSHIGHPFKIKFGLTGYNMPIDDVYTQSGNDYDFVPEMAWNYIFLILLVVVLVLGFVVGMYALVAVMAKRRHRNIVVWVLLSIIATPLLMIVILLVVGDDEEQKAYDERIRRKNEE